jgi:hypothetical protein
MPEATAPDWQRRWTWKFWPVTAAQYSAMT